MKAAKPAKGQKSEQKPPEIAVRCVFSRMVAVSELKPNPRNPNKHPKEQLELLARVIQRQGWRSPVTVSKQSGLIVAGHARYEAARLLGAAEVPVDFQDFASDAEELAHLLADNQLAELAEINEEDLAAVLKDLDGQIEIELTGFDPSKVTEIEQVAFDAAVTKTPKRPELTVSFPPRAWAVSRDEILAKAKEQFEGYGAEISADEA